MADKRRLLIMYDHFFPAYKAGGPIRSLTNLIIHLQNDYEISVLTSAYDLNAIEQLDNVRSNTWVKVTLPGATIPVNVWYAKKNEPQRNTIKSIVKESGADIVYLNGIFSLRFVLLPLLTVNRSKIIICPRGMLQKGALAGKTFKKKLWLTALKISGLVKNVRWHATNEEEAADIKNVFGDSMIGIAGNIPVKPLDNVTPIEKKVGQLRLVYLSLIAAKKNLLPLIEIISGINDVTLDIYGPVKDENYWKKCKEAIQKEPTRIKYKGEISSDLSTGTFGHYNASVLLTKGENFGHALYESLSTGTPVITSYFTPWNDLQEKKAGWNVDISDTAQVKALIGKLVVMDPMSFNEYYKGAHVLATEYYARAADISSYKKLFK